jgi:RNA recognition motif. (a.k.a. RRM, RBD, or RNP domain)
MREYFSQYGKLLTCRIVYNQDSSVSRGFGFVIYSDKEAAERVVQDREHHYLNGKWIDCKSALLRQEMNPNEGSSVRSGGKSNQNGHDRNKRNGQNGSDKSSKGKTRKFNLAKNNFVDPPQLTATSIYSGQGNSFAQMSYARNLPVAASPTSHTHGTRNQLHNPHYIENPNMKAKAMTPGVRSNRNFGQYSAAFEQNNPHYHQILSAVEMDDDLGSPQHGFQYIDSLQSPVPTPVNSRGGFKDVYNRTVDKYFQESQFYQGFPVPVLEDDEFIPEVSASRTIENKSPLLLPGCEDEDLILGPIKKPTYIASSPEVLMEPNHSIVRSILDPTMVGADHQLSPRWKMTPFTQGLKKPFASESYDQREERDERPVSKHMLPFLIESDEIPQMTINSMKKKSHHSSSGSGALNPKQKSSQRGSESPLSIHYEQPRQLQASSFPINSDPRLNSQIVDHMNFSNFPEQPRQHNVMLHFNPEEDLHTGAYDTDMQNRSNMSRFNTHLGGFWTPQGQTPTNNMAQAVEFQQPSAVEEPQFNMVNSHTNQRYSSPKTVPNSHAPMSRALGFSTYMERIVHTRSNPHEG